MNTAKRLSLLLDFLLFAASITTGGPVAEQVRIIAIVVVASLGAAAIFCAVVLCIAVVQQRQPPYPI